MTGLDTNILIHLADVSDPKHVGTADLVQKEINAGEDLLVPPQIVAEFLHVITDSRRFLNPLTMSAALDWIDAFIGNPGVKQLMPTDTLVPQSNQWMRQHNLGRKRILDTQLAATFYLAGCKRLITSNPDDFKIFNCFALISP